jgi:hypothetical protein
MKTEALPTTSPYPIQAGQFVPVYVTEELATLLNDLHDTDRKCGGTGHAPEIYIITAAVNQLPARIKRMKDVVEMNAGRHLVKGGS